VLIEEFNLSLKCHLHRHSIIDILLGSVHNTDVSQL